MQYLVIDLETGSKEYLGRKGCHLVNPIVAATYKNQMINKQLLLFDAEEVMAHVPNSIGILVGHNIKFDLLHLWKSERLQYMLSRGLKIWDTQLAEYILTGQRHKYPALRDIAVNKYGQPEREKKMEAYWDKGIDTTDIPKELVLEDVKYDGLDTEAVMLQQVAEAKRIGIYELIMLEMEGLLATTAMEYNGVYVNQLILESNKKEIEADIQIINAKLKELAPEVENFNSTQQLSRLFFGGIEKVKVDEPILNELGLPETVKSGINRGKIKTRKATKEVLIHGLVKPNDSWKQKKEGIYRTDEGVLQTISEWFRDDEEAFDLGITSEIGVKAKRIADTMLKLRGLNKLLGTYYEGLQKFIHQEDSCVHQNLNHCSTNTGRLSCNKPNLQNQPRD